MKILYVWPVLISLVLVLSAGAQNPSFESRVRIGVLDLAIKGTDGVQTAQAGELLVAAVSEVGFYEVHDQRSIEKAFTDIGKDYPGHCRDPRCIFAVGNAVKLDRILYGSLDKGNNTWGVSLILLDVVRREEIEKVNLESDPGVELKDFLRAVVGKLHGHTDENLGIALHKYFGPEIHNEKQLLVSSALCMGVGLVWALANSASGKAESSRDFNETLSGIPTRAYHIPMFARPAALAHAYTGAADDAYGVLYNPAAMSWVAGPEASLAYQYRFGMNNIAASYVNKATREIGFGQLFMYNGDVEDLSSEVYFVTGISYKFNQILRFLRPFSIGANVKLMSIKSDNEDGSGTHAEYNQSERTFGLGLDWGIRAELSDRIKAGIVFKDAPSFVYVKNTAGGYSYSENNPTVLHIGGTFMVGYATMLFADLQFPLYSDQKWKMAGAIEQQFFRFLNVRLGLTKEIQESENAPWIITGGFGLRFNTESIVGKYVSIDGSYEYNQLGTFSNVINVSFLFGF